MPGVPSRPANQPPATPPHPFSYALIRVVPRVERGECVNVGVVLACRTRRFLATRVETDPIRALALAPDLDVTALQRHLEQIARVAAGDPAGGAIARLSQAERFGWLTAPASTIVQLGPVHAGLCVDPATMLDQLFATMVTAPSATNADYRCP